MFFDDVNTLKKVVSSCHRGIKNHIINEKESWFGIYYENEILNGFNDDVYIKWISPDKGYGLFAKQDLKKDFFIGVYTGKVRKHKRSLDKKNGYCFEYQTGEYKKTPFTVDARYMGNYTRFINHNNNPNLDILNAYLLGITHIILRTNKPIKKDHEIVYDYGKNYWKKREKPL